MFYQRREGSWRSSSRRARNGGVAFEMQQLAGWLSRQGHFRGPSCWPNRRPVSIQLIMARPLTPTAVRGQDAGITQPPDALPDRLRDVEHLEEVMTTPSAALIAALQKLPGDILILGVRSEERRVGKECRSRWSADQERRTE